VELFCQLCIVCKTIFFFLPYRGYGARPAVKLTDREVDELIAEWQPEPLGEFFRTLLLGSIVLCLELVT
jgi:hypothetical protein